MDVRFFIEFLHNSCNFQYLILGWSTLVLSPSIHSNTKHLMVKNTSWQGPGSVLTTYLVSGWVISLVPREGPGDEAR